MGLLPSGSAVEDVELVVIETSELSLYIKGKPFHERYESLKAYRKMKNQDRMYFSYDGIGIEHARVYDVEKGNLGPYQKENQKPIFFENGVYQLVVTSKNGIPLSFHHENPALRKAVGVAGFGSNQLLMGNLYFPNEVGFSTFEIYEGNQQLLEVTLEIFPSKLDYKEDYKRLINEVNEEVYNLAYHFVKRTYLHASSSPTDKPTWSEFYRLLDAHFIKFIKAVERIETQPHHELKTVYQKARGDQLRRIDSIGRSYLRKRPQLFQEVNNGIQIHSKTFMPTHGLMSRKSISIDTLENRFVKWMMNRVIDKLEGLTKKLTKQKGPYEIQIDEWLLNKINRMKNQLKLKVQSYFWQQISQLDRSVMSLVIQMASGYRDAFQIYIIVSRGLLLNGRFYQMSVKDVASLYEYWTFIKLGQILARKYTPVSQDIVKVNRDGLFVNLDSSKSAKRIFKHPITGEKIILHYQKPDRSLPTVSQKPDTVLSIEKKGKDFSYNYIFDAKYRIDFALEGCYYYSQYNGAGPLEEDINTMHRYRDALVIKHGWEYEREAFGAYVLFPGFFEEDYVNHPFYTSIDKVNIGGLPFLPNTTNLVEQFIENLIEKSPEELQKEGILPKGTKEEWISSLDSKVMVANVKSNSEYRKFLNDCFFIIPVKSLKKGWQEAEFISLYLPRGVSNEYNGIYYYSKIDELQIVKGSEVHSVNVADAGEYACFKVKPWNKLGQVIRPVQYGISVYVMTTLNTLKYSNELPELFMKSKEEVTLWRMLRRISNQIKVDLDEKMLDYANNITYLNLRNLDIQIDHSTNLLEIENSVTKKILDLKLLEQKPSKVFKEILDMIED
ncbi:restriction endonuclease-like protein [Paenibacillus sp. BSR1-1]|uniref:restriction endonuclease-like protein n=1 Tax=Paenibacillus sp. BSR1-1 TaxID=3020845 RepID=UPI0025B245B3|nr:restriction endonuclease-like protein [Paenibacillus sp. BSR1-1]MDN3015806.1 restriction endonuclease-like protein [Paenibacillus sp. BSR1-1]